MNKYGESSGQIAASPVPDSHFPRPVQHRACAAVNSEESVAQGSDTPGKNFEVCWMQNCRKEPKAWLLTDLRREHRPFQRSLGKWHQFLNSKFNGQICRLTQEGSWRKPRALPESGKSLLNAGLAHSLKGSASASQPGKKPSEGYRVLLKTA